MVLRRKIKRPQGYRLYKFYELSFIGTIKFCPVYQKGISLIFRKLYCKRRGSAGQG